MEGAAWERQSALGHRRTGGMAIELSAWTVTFLQPWPYPSSVPPVNASRQADVQGLRGKAEELADGVWALSALIHALRGLA